jgi:hypothetical protein
MRSRDPEGQAMFTASRRSFLRTLAFGGLATSLPLLSATAKTSQSSKTFTYTKDVRLLTAKLKIAPSRWRWTVIHHSAIKYGNATIYDKTHRERGMENGLAYHFVIGNGLDSGDGAIEIGPRWKDQLNGGHVHREDLNGVGIGICLVGNFQESKPSVKQIAALRELLDYLRGSPWGRQLKFTVHKEAEPGRTICPGRNFPLAKMQALYGKAKVPKSV